MFFRKKIHKSTYDATKKKPAIRASICTGEQVAGFVDIKSGVFEDVMLIQTPTDLNNFKEQYGIDGIIEKIY